MCSSTNRESIWSSQWLISLFVWPHVAPRPFVAYFPKKNYSRRQIILIFLGFERSLSYQSQFVFLLGLIEVGSRLGKSGAQDRSKIAAEEWPDVASNSATKRPVSTSEKLMLKEDQMLNSVCPASGVTCLHVWSCACWFLRTIRLCVASGHVSSDVSDHHLGISGPLYTQPDSGLLRPIIFTSASGHFNLCGLDPFLL